MGRNSKKKKTPPKEQSASGSSQNEGPEQQPVDASTSAGIGTTNLSSSISTADSTVDEKIASPNVSSINQSEDKEHNQTTTVDEEEGVIKTVETTVDQIADSLATAVTEEATAALVNSSTSCDMDSSRQSSSQLDGAATSCIQADMDIEPVNSPLGRIDDHHYSSSTMAMNGSELNVSDLREVSMMIDSMNTDGERSSFSDSSDVVVVHEDTLRSASDEGETGEMVQVSMSMIEDPDEPIDRKTDIKGPVDASLLPETVTVLNGPVEGSYVYVVGTAHFSESSNQDVEKTIRLVQPNIVVVELCNARYSVLMADEETLLNANSSMSISSMMTSIREEGIVRGLLYTMLVSLSVYLTKELKMAPGGEFRRALAEAKKISGCLLQLGDRPIDITLERAFSSLSVWQKLRFAFSVLFSSEKITAEDVERNKQKDLLHAFLNEISGEFPSFAKVLLDERDTYLAYSLQIAAKPISHVKKPNLLLPSTVVGVVGLGHVDGIKKKFGTVTEADIAPIMTRPAPSIVSIIFIKGFKYTTLCLIGYGIYRYLIPNSVKSLVNRGQSSIVGTVLAPFRSGNSFIPKIKSK